MAHVSLGRPGWDIPSSRPSSDPVRSALPPTLHPGRCSDGKGRGGGEGTGGVSPGSIQPKSGRSEKLGGQKKGVQNTLILHFKGKCR